MMSAYSPTPSPESNSCSDPVDDDEGDKNENSVVTSVFEELIDEVSLGLCFEVHRMNKMGTLFLAESDPDSMTQFALVDQIGLDVFGQVPMKKQLECICPNCSRNLAASRFAPHLEKCMGMGRNSSRIASRRIANAGSKKESDNESDNADDDDEWSSHRGSSKRRKEKGSSKNKRQNKMKNNDQTHQEPPQYESMTLQERKNLLHHTCGVISEHTRRMCTRSFRCPQHSDEQRKAVRAHLLAHRTVLDQADDDAVDIDGYTDGDSQALRDHLQWEAVSNPSPTDSTPSTNSSAGSKKRQVKKNSVTSISRRRGRPSQKYSDMT